MASTLDDQTPVPGTITERLGTAEKAIRSLRILVEALERRVGKIELRLAGASFLGTAACFGAVELIRYLKTIGG